MGLLRAERTLGRRNVELLARRGGRMGNTDKGNATWQNVD